MESKAKSEAAEAYLLLEEERKSLKEEKKSQAKKKKTSKSTKVFKLLNSLFASLTIPFICSKNEWASLCNR